MILARKTNFNQMARNLSEFEKVFFPLFTSHLKNAVVWMIWNIFLINNSSSLFSKTVGTFPNATTIISITFTFIFHCLFCPLARSKYLSIFSFSFIFTLCSTRTALSIRWQVHFILLIKTRFSLLTGIN